MVNRSGICRNRNSSVAIYSSPDKRFLDWWYPQCIVITTLIGVPILCLRFTNVVTWRRSSRLDESHSAWRAHNVVSGSSCVLCCNKAGRFCSRFQTSRRFRFRFRFRCQCFCSRVRTPYPLLPTGYRCYPISHRHRFWSVPWPPSPSFIITLSTTFFPFTTFKKYLPLSWTRDIGSLTKSWWGCLKHRHCGEVTITWSHIVDSADLS